MSELELEEEEGRTKDNRIIGHEILTLVFSFNYV